MDVVAERGIVVDRATILEWPQIEALRLAYFDERREPVQRRGADVVWWVARIGERVVGCYATQDIADEGQRIVHDMYRIRGRVGTRGWAAMARHMAHNRDVDGMTLVGCAAPDNALQIGALARYGWRISGVMMASYPAAR